MGRPEAALKELEQAHRQDPDNLKIVDLLAQIYQDLGQFQRTQELYQEVLARHEAHPALRNNWCFSFYLQGNLARAESCFQEALARDPGNISARNNLGLLWCRQGKLAEAQRLWQETEGAAVAQDRLHLTLGFLGMSPPANYAQAVEPKAGTPPQPAAAPKPVVKVGPAIPAKAAAAQPAILPKPAAAIAASPAKSEVTTSPAPPRVASQPPPGATPPRAELQPAPKPALLTAAELAGTEIEIRNGTRTQNLARSTRTRLSREGFNVIRIGNHIDFGAEATTISYRPEVEKVARALTGIFPGAKLIPDSRLNNRIAIKVVLGSDLPERPGLMSRLTEREP
jgi:hypothetical protein